MPATESEPSTSETVAHFAFAVSARLDAHAAAAGLSSQQVRLLGILRDREPTINELAGRLGIDKSSMSGAVVRAERRGLVRRVPDERDARSVRVRLEDAGRTLLDAAAERFEADVHGILSVLSERQRAQWQSLTERLLAAELAAGAPSDRAPTRQQVTPLRPQASRTTA